MIPFSKFHGAGNDFILIDNRDQRWELGPDTIEAMCHRRFGIGADGVILVEPSSQADFRMRIFNSDGGEASQCGNGIRCLAAFVRKLGMTANAFHLETKAGIVAVSWRGTQISVEMGKPKLLGTRELNTSLGVLTAFVADTGVPHAVIFVEDVDLVKLEQLGPEVRFHPEFDPHGVNVNVVDRRLAIRTFERGIEDETLACGTGACASALAAARQFALPSPISLLTRSGEQLTISFPPDMASVCMTGSALFVYEGTYEESCCQKACAPQEACF